MSKLRALVTGATGFVGSHLAEALVAAGYEVSCLVRPTSDLKWLRGLEIKLLPGSVTDEPSLAAAVREQDCIFHVAGLTKARRVAEFFEVNAKGTHNVLSACKQQNPTVRRVVYVSSQAAAGPSPDGTPLTENSPCRPVSLYGKSKYEGERAVAQYAADLPATIVRPSAVYGPRDRDIFFVFQLANRGILPVIGSRDMRVNLIHVKDLVRAIMLAAESDKAVGQTYFATDPAPYRWTETGTLVAAALGKKCLRIRIPIFAISLVAAAARVVSVFQYSPPLLSPDKVRELKQRYWVCSTVKISSTLGFAPQYSLAEGLSETARWYRDNHWLK